MYKYNFWIYYLPFTRQTSQGNLVLICPVCLEPGQMKLSHMQHYLMSACRMVLGWAIHWFDCWQNWREKSRSRNQNKCTSDSMRHISQLSKASKWAEMQKTQTADSMPTTRKLFVWRLNNIPFCGLRLARTNYAQKTYLWPHWYGFLHHQWIEPYYDVVLERKWH